ncbi:hypothetical protein BCR44DRAFT_28011 [Catenaria anguillulae PL171]|uniref:Uncharacterized protein n=1 Tax=Catenaria anguillulae PL171 TaxID=765915 RepID=A0A1Y2HSN9_9FUNG|nr:hypothetical protein BCR44DRAFT_28011 [Catenaria anguillulae PL171]
MSSDGSSVQVFVRVRPPNPREIAAGSESCIDVSPDGTSITVYSSNNAAAPNSSSSVSGSTSTSPSPIPPTSISPTMGMPATPRGSIISIASTVNKRASNMDLGGAFDRKNEFAFDRCFVSQAQDAPGADQQTVFDVVAKPLLEHAFEGYNVCLFAYGQTGSGKTYTMMGRQGDGCAGIIPRASAYLFTEIARRKQLEDPSGATVGFSVEASFMEIYCEKVKDLLNPMNKGKLRVREHPSLGPYVEDLSKLILTSADDFLRLIESGNQLRTVGHTNMNDESSRSHAVFQVVLTQTRYDPETRLASERVSRISFVDLAGSERANSTGATGQRLKEGANINKSLTSLGKVISALADVSAGRAGKQSMHVPYRDSVLTWLLKDSLGGNSKTHMVSCISPAAINASETLSTLRYSDRAKRIVNRAKVNEDPNAKLITDLKSEINELRRQLSNADRSSPGGNRPEPEVLGQLQDQLRSSEKLMQELNETWEEKLRRTQEIAHEKDRVLAELGIKIGNGHVGITSPKRHPHLLNQQPNSLNESLVYTLPPGKTTLGSALDSGIVLDKLQPCHAVIYNSDHVVLLQPRGAPGSGGYDMYVNSQLVTKTVILQSGDQIRLGTEYLFRFIHPRRKTKSLGGRAPVTTTRRDPMRTLATRLAEQVRWKRIERGLFSDARHQSALIKKANVWARELGYKVVYQLHIEGGGDAGGTGGPRIAVKVFDLGMRAVRVWSLKEFGQRVADMELVYGSNSVPQRNPFVPAYAPVDRAGGGLGVSGSRRASRIGDDEDESGGGDDVDDDDDVDVDSSTLVGTVRVGLRQSGDATVAIVSTLSNQSILGFLQLHVTQRGSAVDIMVMELTGNPNNPDFKQLDHFRLAVRYRSSVHWTEAMAGFTGTMSIPFLSSASFFVPATALAASPTAPGRGGGGMGRANSGSGTGTLSRSGSSGALADSIDHVLIEVYAQIADDLMPLVTRELDLDMAMISQSPEILSSPTKYLVMANIQVLQLDENGFFVPVAIDQPRDVSSSIRPPVVRLRHGMLRRIHVTLTSPIAYPAAVEQVELGQWRWISPNGTQVVHGGMTLALPKLRETHTEVQRTGQSVIEVQFAWDSSLHEFFYLNRPSTSESGTLMATMAVETAEGWTLTTDLSFTSTLRGGSGDNVSRSAMSLWNVQRLPFHSTASEYIRGEESLGSFYVLGSKDGGAGLITRAVQHMAWLSRMRDVERTRLWLASQAARFHRRSLPEIPPIPPQYWRQSTTSTESGMSNAGGGAGAPVDESFAAAVAALRGGARTWAAPSLSAEDRGAKTWSASDTSSSSTSFMLPYTSQRSGAPEKPLPLTPPESVVAPLSSESTAPAGAAWATSSSPRSTSPGLDTDVDPDADGDAMVTAHATPSSSPETHRSPIVLTQTALTLWMRPPLDSVLTPDIRLRHGQGGRLRESVVCDLVASLPSVSKRGFLLLESAEDSDGPTMATTTSASTTLPRSSSRSSVLMTAPHGREWARVWLVIRRPYILLYESPDEHVEHGFIHLLNSRIECGSNLTSETSSNHSGNDPSSTDFSLVTPDCVFNFRCQSSSDLLAWITAIDPLYVAAMQSNRMVGLGPSPRGTPERVRSLRGKQQQQVRDRPSLANMAASWFGFRTSPSASGLS